MRLAGIGRAFRDLPGAFDALQRDAHLGIARGLGQLFDGVPVPVAAGEIHASVHGDRIALEDLLDQTDALEELAPVERRDESEASNQVRHEGLFGRLMPRLRTDGVLNRLTARGQCRIELVAQRRCSLAFARPLKQADDERRMHVRRPAIAHVCGCLERVHQSIRVEAVGATRREDVRPRAQVFHQRQLQRRRPRPELAHCQGRNRLERRDESVQALRVETPGAAPNQLERHRVDARQARELVGSDPREPPKERGRQIVMDIAERGENDVEVVEQPLGRRRRRLSALRVVGQRRVDLSKRARMLAQSLQVRAAVTAPARGNGEQGGQPPRVLFERFNSKELDRPWRRTGDAGVTH